MKKSGLNLIALILLVSTGVYFFSVRSLDTTLSAAPRFEKSANQSAGTQKNSFKKSQPIDVIKPIEVVTLHREIVSNEKRDVQHKIEKALHHIQKKSREPAGQLQVDSQLLQSHQAFAGTRWKLLSNVRAVSTGNESIKGISVGTLNHYQLIESADESGGLQKFDRSSPTVVYETRLKKAGLVTGLIKVETANPDLLKKALLGMNAQVTSSFADIQIYFITSVQNVFDLEKLFFDLKSLDFVKNVELDIVDRNYEKK